MLRRIERLARANIATYRDYSPRYRNGRGAVMRGAQAEARGVVAACQEFREECRRIRGRILGEPPARREG